MTELANQQKFELFNDGYNTYLESVLDLVVTCATANGERYIVNEVPQQIRGFMNSKPITVVRGTATIPKPAALDPAVVHAQIKQLSDKLEAFTAKVRAAGAQGSSLSGDGNGSHALGRPMPQRAVP